MANLGSFGTPREAVDEENTFDYFGEEIRVHPQVGPLLMSELMSRIAGNDTNVLDARAAAIAAREKGEEPPEWAARAMLEAMMVTKNYARAYVHADDFERFWLTAMANQQTPEDLMTVGNQLIEVCSARPTKSPADSSVGRPATSPSLKEISYVTALERLKGRPDLQSVLVEVHDRRGNALAVSA